MPMNFTELAIKIEELRKKKEKGNITQEEEKELRYLLQTRRELFEMMDIPLEELNRYNKNIL